MYHFEEQSPNVLALPGNQGKKISPWTGCYGFDDLTNLGEINLAYDPYFTHLSGDKKLGYGIVGVKSPEIPIWEGFINFFRIILIVLLSCMLVFFLSNKAETHPTHDSHVHTEHTIVDKAELHIITPITNTVTNTLGINEPSTETSETVRLTVPAGTNDRKVKVCFTGNAKHGMDYEIYYPNKITPTDGCIVLTVAGGDVSEDFNIKILNNPAATDMIRKVYMTMEDVDTTTPELNNINVHIAISDRDITTVVPSVTPTVSITGVSPVNESGTAIFTLTASTAPTTDISVNVNVADSGNFAGSDQTGIKTVTIAANSATKTLEVELVDDSNDEPDGTITATVQSGSGYTEGNPSSASIAVQDNDDLQIVFNQKALVVMEGSSETYTVKLTSKPSSQMNIGIRIHPEGDVTVTPEQVSFGPSDWNTEKTISITADEDEDKVSEKIQLIHTFDVRTDTVQVTVRDNDIPPSESVGVGLVRFGRTVGEQSVSAIAERISASRYPNFKGMLAGQTLSAVRCDNNMVKKPGTLDSLKQQHSCLGNESQWSDSVEFPPPSTQTRPLSEEEIVAGTSFALTREIDTGDLVTIWGQGARSGFSGKDKTYSVKGYVTGFQLGVDWSHYNQLYGVMLSRSNGDIQYWNDDKTEGDIDFGLTAVVPYMGWRVNDDYMIWGGLGFGNGDLTRLEVNADEIKADLSWRMAALGTEGTLPEIQALAGAELSWSTDVLWTQTRSDGVENSLDPLSGKTLRRRMGFKSTWERIIASGSILRPSLEVALRNDSGDAETGLGLQAGGGLEWIDSKRGLSLRLRGQKLIMHEKDEFKNWGVSISLIYDPAPETKEGFAANLSHNVGEPPLESSKLLQAESIPKIEDINEEKSWSAEMAYGVSQGNGKVGSSYMAVNGGSEAETARLGYRIEPDLDYAQNMMVDVWTEPEVGSSEKSRETGSSVGINLVSRW